LVPYRQHVQCWESRGVFALWSEDESRGLCVRVCVCVGGGRRGEGVQDVAALCRVTRRL
jgi:hypothetical protein